MWILDTGYSMLDTGCRILKAIRYRAKARGKRFRDLRAKASRHRVKGR
jgi:hypothetical protein